jgi:hypothetical protein
MPPELIGIIVMMLALLAAVWVSLRRPREHRMGWMEEPTHKHIARVVAREREREAAETRARLARLTQPNGSKTDLEDR